jgi:hypothetical protein
MKNQILAVVALAVIAIAPAFADAQSLTPILREWGGSQVNTATTGTGPQSQLWKHFASRTRERDYTSDDVQFFDSFANFGVGSGTVYKGYGIHLDTGNTIQEIATEIGGVISFDTDATDNDSCELTTGGNVGVLVKIPSSAGDVVIFDACWRPNQVTNTYNWFIGLTQEGRAIDDGVFTDAGASADIDQVGFRVLEADGDACEFVYKTAGQTIQVTTGLKALSANTWVRTGFVFNPAWPVASRLRVYVDNGETSTKLTSTNIAAATFPAGEELALTAAMKNQTTAAQSVDVGYWGAAQAQ